ncbi:hypothetical protein [Nocardia pseudovaccinii]|uniref:hypothetical protein n=1 Tax=Nocardia pseudovaccinii TaxID=189540 RepID=UPI0012F49AF6|nr:hypothetical protein [Nocardia pseudovaccinii]
MDLMASLPGDRWLPFTANSSPSRTLAVGFAVAFAAIFTQVKRLIRRFAASTANFFEYSAHMERALHRNKPSETKTPLLGSPAPREKLAVLAVEHLKTRSEL